MHIEAVGAVHVMTLVSLEDFLDQTLQVSGAGDTLPGMPAEAKQRTAGPD